MKPVFRVEEGVAVVAALVAAGETAAVVAVASRAAVAMGVAVAAPTVVVAIDVGIGVGEVAATAGVPVGVGVVAAAVAGWPSCLGFLTSSSVPAVRTWSAVRGPAAPIICAG